MIVGGDWSPCIRLNSRSAARRPTSAGSCAITVMPGSIAAASGDVVEAQVRDLVLQPEFVQRRDDTDDDQVLAAEDALRPGGGEQSERRPPGLLGAA
jgi:hypothetical protein